MSDCPEYSHGLHDPADCDDGMEDPQPTPPGAQTTADERAEVRRFWEAEPPPLASDDFALRLLDDYDRLTQERDEARELADGHLAMCEEAIRQRDAAEAQRDTAQAQLRRAQEALGSLQREIVTCGNCAYHQHMLMGAPPYYGSDQREHTCPLCDQKAQREWIARHPATALAPDAAEAPDVLG